MGLPEAKRIIMRLREKCGDHCNETDLRRAIMIEVGIDFRTIKKYKDVLLELEWLKREAKYRYKIDTNDITGNMF